MIIFLAWDYNGQDGVIRAWERLGYRVEVLPINASGNIANDPDFIGRMEALLSDVEKAGDPCRLVFSHDYFPVASEVCQRHDIPYISHVYDSPHYTLTSPATAGEMNHIHVFDRGLIEELEAAGTQHLYHTLLSADPEMAEKTAGFKTQSYEHDISFVGSLYRDQYTFYDQIRGLPEQLKEITDLAIAAQRRIFGVDILGDPQTMPDKIIDMLGNYVHFDLTDDYRLEPRMLLRDILRKKVTSLERYDILTGLGKNFDVALYTNPGAETPAGVRNLGYAGYDTEVPRIYSRSRINLNITLRTIRTGIPQRALDIMACGGFLLSDYREELAEYFVEGEDLALARTPEEFVTLAGYYLEHEEERERIALSGQKKVLENYTHDKVFAEMVRGARPACL